MSSRLGRWAMVVGVLGFGWAGAPEAVAAQCADGGTTLGVGVFHCQGGDCARHRREDGARAYDFTVRPRLFHVDEASGLREGDELLSVDGWPVTTAEAGRLLGDVEAGRTRAVLRVRQPGQAARDVPSRAATCVASRLVVTAAGDADWAEELTGEGEVPRLGLLGLTLSCTSCTSVFGADGLRWQLDEQPRVVAVVAGGPADRAGVRVGDLIARIEGADVRSPEAAAFLGTVATRSTVRLSVVRDGAPLDVVVRVR